MLYIFLFVNTNKFLFSFCIRPTVHNSSEFLLRAAFLKRKSPLRRVTAKAAEHSEEDFFLFPVP